MNSLLFSLPVQKLLLLVTIQPITNKRDMAVTDT